MMNGDKGRNSLTSNGLTSNGLTSNGLTSNGLTLKWVAGRSRGW